MRLLTRNSRRQQRTTTDLSSACQNLMHDVNKRGIHLARQRRTTQARVQAVHDDGVGLWDVFLAEFADGEDFEELGDVVPVAHACGFGVAEGGEDGGGGAFWERGEHVDFAGHDHQARGRGVLFGGALEDWEEKEGEEEG